MVRIGIGIALVGAAWTLDLVTPLRDAEHSLHVYLAVVVVVLAVFLSIVIPLPTGTGSSK